MIMPFGEVGFLVLTKLFFCDILRLKIIDFGADGGLCMDRINTLREMALTKTRSNEGFHYLFYKEYAKHPELSEEGRYAKAFYSAFSKLEPEISQGELIVGKSVTPLDGEEKQEWKEIYRPLANERYGKAGGGQDSHMAIDYRLLLSVGIKGIIEKIDRYSAEENKESIDYYDCCKECLRAVVKHSENYSDHALRLSALAESEKQRAELLEIARICKKVPYEPADSFHEAVQSVHFISHCLSFDPFRPWAQQFQLGHPDRYLLEYYENDLKNGKLTHERAQLILDCLGIQINLRVPNGLSSGYMIGGRDEGGRIVANDLTDMCMQVTDDIRLVYPAVGLCYDKDMPEVYLKKACELLLKGYSHPAIFNDGVITKGLAYYGVDAKQAREYVHSTCVEITPVGSSNVWVASPYTNMPQLLLDIMDEEYISFDSLLERYFSRLSESIKRNHREQKAQRAIRADNSIKPLLSCFVHDCLERGVDIDRGGARYNWIMPSFVGVANLVDSLYAVKTLVFDEKKLGMAEFKAMLESDYRSEEELRLHILNGIPKYGNDVDEVDRLFGIITERIISECEEESRGEESSALIPSVFCWVMHEHFGRNTIATPDARKAGFPLGDGSGPCQGRELNGPTASIISSTKWDHSKFIGGVAVNLKFSKHSLGEELVNTLMALVKTYMDRGGFELQINVTDNETLKKAIAEPEKYRDLVVRIGGYSDYFVKLSPKMQEEVILRTSHSI